ncbi:MAG: AMP-binding protein [Betaproteobacteria bacterium]|nr:AMP-binding protein [Betaproteobacteria bacterium]
MDPSPSLTSEAPAARLLATLAQLLAELHAQREGRAAPTLGSALDRELGLDSLARVELLFRLEREFGVSLPEQLISTAETPRDLLDAVLAAQPERERAPFETVAPRPAPAAGALPEHAATLAEVLDWHVQRHGTRAHITIVDAAGREEHLVTYAALRDGAREVAAGLVRRDLQPGESVAIMLPTGRDYFLSFFGILLAGGVPVPIYPPARLTQIEDHFRRHAGILANAQAVALITVPEALHLARLLTAQVETLRTVVTVEQLCGSGQRPPRPALRAHATALLQYTSGSTGDPKGVVLTHANLLANIRAMGQAVRAGPGDAFVSWLPLYHDMGLIGAWLGSLYYALPLIVMSPLVFLARPERWLWAIHRYRGTLSAAPNFAYELCLRRVAERDIAGLDLSSWRLAFNGAEPVSPDTMQRFAERFAPCRLNPEAIAPVYGLAECSVGLAFPPLGRGLLVDRVKRSAFMRHARAEPAGADEPDALRFVACGRPLPGHQVRVVDATGQEVGERTEGRLEFSGPSATSGYFRRPEATRQLLHGKWLDSGDFAYIAGGDIYLTGRVKDVIIRGGRNLYPYELEEAVGDIPGIRRGCVAAFGSRDPATGTERLVVMAETREQDAAAREKLRAAINAVAVDLLGSPPDDVVLAPVHTVLKTSSGKIRRAASRALYESRGIGARRPPVWLQLARLACSGAVAQLHRARRTVTDVAYALYAWLLLALMAPPVWLAAALSRSATQAWSFSRVAARWFIRLSATPFSVEGLDRLPAPPYVMVVNHASYLDGLTLVAALPAHCVFVAKRELEDNFVSRVFLRRLGAVFVERFRFQQGAADAQRVAELARARQSLIFFPEGTFTRAPGLLPFHLGAFIAATQTSSPVVPVTIRGTRSILRGDQLFPRRGAITVTIGAPIAPRGSDWHAAIELRNAARNAVLASCGEPDLAAAPE